MDADTLQHLQATAFQKFQMQLPDLIKKAQETEYAQSQMKRPSTEDPFVSSPVASPPLPSPLLDVFAEGATSTRDRSRSASLNLVGTDRCVV